MRGIVWAALLLAIVFVFPSVAVSQPVVRGTVVVFFGDGAQYRNDAVIAGIEQALAGVSGVTVLIPRNRPYSIRDAELAGIETVVEIYLAEVISRADQNLNVSLGNGWVSGTRTIVRVRLGLKFLRVLGTGTYLQFLGTGEAEGSAEGMTYLTGYISSFGSVNSSWTPNLEAAAFRNAAVPIIGR